MKDPHPRRHAQRILRHTSTAGVPRTRQIGELHRVPVLDHHRRFASRTPRPLNTGLDGDSKPVPAVTDVKDCYLGQADQQLTHGNRIR